jgi:hypothetical protein
MAKRLFVLLVLVLAVVLIWGCPKDDKKNPVAPQKSITITAPNGGESWQVASSHNITWTSSDVSNVTISYSVDGGTTYADIATNVANTNTQAWTVPNQVAATCRVKVVDASDASVADVSNANFAIVAQSGTDNASGTASSDGTNDVTVETPAGARVVIPRGAVPTFEDGTPCTQTFSIERSSDAPPTLPQGVNSAGAGYRFGPEGFTFGAPVQITIPVTGVPDSTPVYLYYTDEASGELRRVSAIYDPTTHNVTAQTYHLSMWWPGFGPQVNDACGCLHVTNSTVNQWLSICVNTYSLTFPDQAQWMSSYSGGGLWAPVGHIGIANESKFQLPQGTYNLCVQYSNEGTEVYHHYYTDVSILSAYDYFFHPNCAADFNFTGGSGLDSAGRCVCVPTPSTPVHTGDVQISLTWFSRTSAGLDLDLHVIEPDSEEIAYYHRNSASGGHLDRDMICGDWRNGATENVYWTTNPPHGLYVVKAHFFGNCGSGDTTQTFTVRTVVHGNTSSFSGRLSTSEMREITRFTYSGLSPEFLPPRDDSQVVVLPSKN